MKKITLLVILCYSLLNVVHAQTPPNAFNYSAVARNSVGLPVANTNISIAIDILKTSSTGPSQYSEKHFVNTDAFGLFNIVVGAGSVQSGSMATIDWSNDNYFLQVGMDTSGGTNILIMGTTQLLSVPYALYAKSAGNVIGGSNPSHFIGEQFGGGVIFHLWKDAQGVEHGLIVDTVELSTAQSWSNVGETSIGSSAQSTWDGLNNSNAIVEQPGHTNSAAALCLNSTNGGQSDWYLPSVEEMDRLYDSRNDVNVSLRSISGATELLRWDNTNGSVLYWTSTEWLETWSFIFNFSGGGSGYDSKMVTWYVRAIRAF